MSARSLNWLKFGGLVALAFALGLLFAGLLDLPSRTSAQEQGTATSAIAPVPAPSIPAARPLQDLSEAFAAVAEHVKPSVVYIRSQRTEHTTKQRIPPGMERFFPRFRQQPEIEQGSGSGFIISADGFILTNNHVVEGAEAGSLTVSFDDGTSAKAQVLGTDPLTDTAVIKADGVSDLTPATIGKSANLGVGEGVVAIGSPFGLDATVTSGIVSALDRPVNVGSDDQGNSTTYPAIQTDAAINPGNSGGPLVDMTGAVIGINSSIRTAASQSAGGQSGSIGLGFAIPIDEVMPIVDQMAAGETPTHARLGIQVGDAETGEAAGAVVREVTSGSAADKAGLESGSVITKVDDHRVTGADSLVATIRSYRPGDSVSVTWTSGGQEQSAEIVLDSDATQG